MQTYAPPVLAARIFPRGRAATALLVIGFALFTALSAQFEILLPLTPVPITGQTLAVLLAGATLGLGAGAASQILYVLLGAAGLPFFAGGASGWSYLFGATGGYLIGFVLAAALVGRLAERRADRRVITALPTFVIGNLVIYALGVPWLAAVLDLGIPEAIRLGVVPFLIGDLLKIVMAGSLLPIAWRLVERR